MMRCYVDNKRIIRFMKIMSLMENVVCIYPSSVLSGMCSEANLADLVYSDVSEERFKFQFTLQLKLQSSRIGETGDKITATGFSFRDKSDGIESAALAALDLLMYFHGIRSTLHNDLLFVDHRPLYNQLAGGLKDSSAALLGLVSEISCLIGKIGESRILFEAEKSTISTCSANSNQSGNLVESVALVNDCKTELQSICDFFSAGIVEHTEKIRWRCRLHRFHRKGYFQALYEQHKNLDIRVECISSLKATLDRVCEKSEYSTGILLSKLLSEDCYIAEISFSKETGDNNSEDCVKISSVSRSSISECERHAIHDAIGVICVREGKRRSEDCRPRLS